MKRRYILSAPLIVLAILIVTNPSLRDFKEFLGVKRDYGIRRTKNLFAFSIYQFGNDSYTAIFGNFYRIASHPNDIAISDSSKMEIDTEWKPPATDIPVYDTAKAKDKDPLSILKSSHTQK